MLLRNEWLLLLLLGSHFLLPGSVTNVTLFDCLLTSIRGIMVVTAVTFEVAMHASTSHQSYLYSVVRDHAMCTRTLCVVWRVA